MDIMVPVYSKEAKRMRKAVLKEDAFKLMNIFKQEPLELSNRWIERYKFYCESIKNGNVFVLAGILRDIAGASKKKALSKSDLRYFKEILNQVSSEISLVLEINLGETEKLILSYLGLGDDFC
jgi:RNA polymerase-interacting CarD/CdnL/TRCF family regulator